MSEESTEAGDDDPMHAGMEGLIAAMRARRPGPPPRDIGMDSTMLASEGSTGEGIAAAPWHAIGVDAAAPAHGLECGAVVGRYVVLQQLGVGGMGVVHAAHDPELDRKVALKLLLPGKASAGGRLRLLQEAQTLAKLSHPHVVTVYDVGTVGEQVWLAMELVQGQTLRQWLATPRSWREVVKVMRSAGDGLAAAHAAAVLHRDFKPENVMVGDDGRVRVMDFGLAQVRSRATSEDEVAAGSAREAKAVSATQARGFAGTVPYMAPEQFGGKDLTVAADQFAFCVTLWEALYGKRPFTGGTWMEHVANVLAGRLRPPSRGREVPAWLRRACERGLAIDPRQRWPSMRALLDVLDKGRARARVRTGLAAVGVLLVLATSAEGYRRYDIAQRTAACEATGNEMDAVWSPERAEALREALLATKASYAATTADHVMPWLDRQAEAWRGARVETCLDADVHGRWGAELRERSLWCLDERRVGLDALVEELASADAKALPKAVAAAASLPSLAPCRDVRVLESLVMPSTAERETVRSVRADLLRASSLEGLGRYQEGLELASAALERTSGLEWRPLRAAARLRVGSLQSATGSYAEAEAALEEAYFDAVGGAAPEVALEVALKLSFVVGYLAGRPVDGLRWLRLAEVELSQLPADDIRRAQWLGNQAVLRVTAGDPDVAGPLFEQALRITEDALGPEHPFVAGVVENLANVRVTTGDDDEAVSLYERALVIRVQVLGADHPAVAQTLVHLANVHVHSGEAAKARAGFEQACAIWERALGTEHPNMAMCTTGLGSVAMEVGDLEGAKGFYRQALVLHERRSGPDHPLVAEGLVNLADAHVAAGEHDEAMPLLQRALAIDERALGPDAPPAGYPLVRLAKIALAQGRPLDALSLAQRAAALREHEGVAPDERAEARFVLAQALWEAPPGEGGDRRRAVAMAEQARDQLRGVGKGAVVEPASVDAWLVSHGASGPTPPAGP